MSNIPHARNARYAHIPEYEPYGDGTGETVLAEMPWTLGVWDVPGAYGDTYAPACHGDAYAPAYDEDTGVPAYDEDTGALAYDEDTRGPAYHEACAPAYFEDTCAPALHEAADAPAHENTYRPPYGDTYVPAYEEPEPPVLPWQAGIAVVGRRAARRRRMRCAERADSMRRLLPRALVVAFLAGGTTAFVAEDKTIELTVDGKSRTLHTFADDVTELLAEQGMEVRVHDVVTPAPGAELADGDEVAVRYGRPLRLTLDGRRREVWTTALTVQGALRELRVRAEGAYVSVARSRRIGRAGLALDVRTERAVTIMADGRARTIRTNAATVREAVEQAGITLRGQDATSVPPGSFPRDGQTVTVLRITGTKEVHDESMPFDVVRTEDSSLFRGTEVVERAGQPGLRRVTFSLRTVNGVEQRPRRIRADVVREPRAQMVKVGTKPLPASARGADDLNWQGLAECESGGRPDAVDPSGTYGGLYQFDTRTWQSLGGDGRPQDAAAAEQTYRAKKLYAQRGASPWPHCGARLHE